MGGCFGNMTRLEQSNKHWILCKLKLMLKLGLEDWTQIGIYAAGHHWLSDQLAAENLLKHKNKTSHSLVHLVWPNTEKRIYRPFMG